MGVKQDALASDLGLSQQAISNIEQRETLDAKVLEEIAGVLKVPVDAIKNFDEQATIFNIQNMNDNAQAIYQYNLNPIDKWLEALEENKKLYERLLQAEKEKVEMLERLLREK